MQVIYFILALGGNPGPNHNVSLVSDLFNIGDIGGNKIET